MPPFLDDIPHMDKKNLYFFNSDWKTMIEMSEKYGKMRIIHLMIIVGGENDNNI
jgi:hypothetical protein